MKHRCPLCKQRLARRACPALGHQICAVCCGTKRLVEINCPSNCSYLVSSKNHPPAIVQREMEHDFAFFLPMLQGLTERQHQLFIRIHEFLRDERPDASARVDDDVVHATKALAETFETASRGIIYEHGAADVRSDRLRLDLKAMIDIQRSEGLQILDSEAAVVMRRIERGARNARTNLQDDKTAYLKMLKRILRDPKKKNDGPSSKKLDSGSSNLIIPGP